MKNVENIIYFSILVILCIWGPIWGPCMALKWLAELKKSRKSSFFDLWAPNWAPNRIEWKFWIKKILSFFCDTYLGPYLGPQASTGRWKCKKRGKIQWSLCFMGPKFRIVGPQIGPQIFWIKKYINSPFFGRKNQSYIFFTFVFSITWILNYQIMPKSMNQAWSGQKSSSKINVPMHFLAKKLL